MSSRLTHVDHVQCHELPNSRKIQTHVCHYNVMGDTVHDTLHILRIFFAVNSCTRSPWNFPICNLQWARATPKKTEQYTVKPNYVVPNHGTTFFKETFSDCYRCYGLVTWSFCGEASRTRIGGMWVGARARDSLPLDGKKPTCTSHKWRSNGERFQARVKCLNSGGAYLLVKIHRTPHDPTKSPGFCL